jgi:predicted O-methyltransferase YrrM
VRSFLFRFKSLVNYWLDAASVYSLHSPFLFDFYTKILTQKFVHPQFASLAKVRIELQKDHRIIHVDDLGAGSVHLQRKERRISDLAFITTSPEKFSLLYSRIIFHYKYRRVVELGTSIGINAMYLAKADESVHVATFEGSQEVASIARQVFKENQVTNIQIIEGNIDHTLPTYLSSVERIDFALIDANHRLKPTMQYADLLMEKIHAHSIIAIDDIHYSSEMEDAWRAIQRDQRVYTTIDLYRCGLIFFNPSLSKQNVVLQF